VKRYDQAYFDRWYRHPDHRIGSRADLERSVALAVALAEAVLGRNITSVLDVGAGEGRWQPVLRRLRPVARYLGIEPSAWAVARWGRRRGLIRGDLDAVPDLAVGGPFDLVVCADVLHYLPTPALRRGLRRLAPVVDGLAWCPTFTADDAIAGDHRGFQRRRADTYRRAFGEAGLVPVGMHGWVPRGKLGDLADLERPPRGVG
jgi:SAM-dependent methyltransferase